ncbi:hypothetical protein RDABS01_022278 [Bienertia sinuspersici]
MMSGCGSRIGNDKKTFVLIDVWVGNFLVKFKRNAPLEQGETPKSVMDLMRGQKWNAPKIWKWFEISDAQRILSVYIPEELKLDELSRGSPLKFWKALWKAQMSQQRRSFCWNLVQNALPTEDNLQKSKIEVNSACLWEGRDIEPSVSKLRSCQEDLEKLGLRVDRSFFPNYEHILLRVNLQEVLALASTEFARWHKRFFEDTTKAKVERQDLDEEREPLS